MKFWVGDYKADTSHLSTEENGAYLLILFDYWWHQRGPINNEKTLREITKLSAHKWKNISPTILEFFEIRDGRLYHPRVEEELEKAQGKSEQARNAVNSRLDRQSTDVGTDVVLSHSHSQSQNHKNQIKKKKTSKKKKNKTAAPAEFDITPEMKKWAEPLGFSTAALIAQTEIFLDWHRARGNKFVNWNAAWRNWIKKAKQFADDEK